MNSQPSPPAFRSLPDFKAHHERVAFWQPYIDLVLDRHDLRNPTITPIAGHNSTYPTFICGEIIVKFFGAMPQWLKSYEAERAGLELVATDPEICAPELLGHGDLHPESDHGWAYLITSRVPGMAVWRADLTYAERESVAGQLGEQIQRLHAIAPTGVMTHGDWATVDIVAANRRSSLPVHLIEQIREYVAPLEDSDRVFINSDIVADHIYVEGDRIVGIIDWGDAMAGERHMELIQIYRDLFECDPSLLKIFLEASDWPVTDGFPHRALGYGLWRQATMIAQHNGGDVFEPIAEKFPLDDIATLDDLAEVLFDTR